MNRIRVRRHLLGTRILHWLIVIEGIILGLTGMQLGGIWGIRIFPEGGTWSIHVVTGLAWIFTALYLVYYLVATGEYKWYGLSRLPYGCRYLLNEIKAWFGSGIHIHEPIKFDNDNKEYVEKLIPTEIIVWWIFVILGILIMISGLGMAFPEQFRPLLDFFKIFGFIFGGGAYSIARSIHLLSMFIILGIFILHVYAVFLYRLVKSMIFGEREEPVA